MSKIECEETVIMPEFEEALIGITTDNKAVYDYSKIVEVLVERDKMTTEEAVEYVDYNVLRAIPYMGEYCPVVINLFD